MKLSALLKRLQKLDQDIEVESCDLRLQSQDQAQFWRVRDQQDAVAANGLGITLMGPRH